MDYTFIGIGIMLAIVHAQVPPSCYNGQDPCDLTYPCVIDVKAPSNTSCDDYYLCVASYEWAPLLDFCPSDQVFDYNMCDCGNLTSAMCFDESTHCANPQVPHPTDPSIAPEPCNPPPSCVDGETLPDVGICTRYHTCVGNAWASRACASGMYFNTLIDDCTTDPFTCVNNPCRGGKPATTTTTTTTTPSPASCSTVSCRPGFPCTFGSKVAHPSQCQSFYQCVASFEWILVQGCSINDEFDVVTCECQTDGLCFDETSCSGGRAEPPASRSYTDPKPCVAEGECTDGNTVSDAYTCSRYHQCTAGSWVAQTCQMDWYYDYSSRKCINDVDVCTDNPCLGYSQPPSSGLSDTDYIIIISVLSALCALLIIIIIVICCDRERDDRDKGKHYRNDDDTSSDASSRNGHSRHGFYSKGEDAFHNNEYIHVHHKTQLVVTSPRSENSQL